MKQHNYYTTYRYPNNYALIVWVAVLFMCANNQAFSQSSDTIFMNHLNAVGGLEHIKNAQTILFSGYCIDAMIKKTLPINIYKKTPNLMRYERIDGTDTTYSCFDGNIHYLGSSPERAIISRLSKMRMANSRILHINGFINDYLDVADKAILIGIDSTDNSSSFELVYSKSVLGNFIWLWPTSITRLLV